MVETAQVTTTAVFKFESSSSPETSLSDNSSINLDTMSTASAAGTLATMLPSWEYDTPSKYSPIKVEPSFDNDIVLAELKPAPIYDYESTSLTGFDSVLTSTAVAATNNNNKGATDLNLSSPGAPGSQASTSSSSSSSTSAPQYNSGQSDVTSSGSTSPPGLTKWETLDISVSKDAFDDIGPFVGMLMSADSTVPNVEDPSDLDSIDIKPLTLAGEINFSEGMMTTSGTTTTTLQPVTAIAVTQNGNPTTIVTNINGQTGLPTSLSSSLSCHRVNSLGNPVINATPPYLQMGSGPTTSISVTNSSTLQSLLQGSLHPAPPSSIQGKVTQLQQREGPVTTLQPASTQLPPPPYSILHNRLTHGPPTSIVAQPPANSQIIKVDSTFDLIKSETSPGSGSGSYSSSYADTLPHSTQSPMNHVTTSDQSTTDLQQRLNELGGLKIKTAKKVRKCSMGGNGSGSASSSANTAANAALGGLDQNNKKMMHHCGICHRGFLNKSNIKVHLRTHTGEKPFQCEHCSKAFRQKAHLLKHMSIHKRISRD